MTLLALGDSISAGWGLRPPARSWVGWLAEALEIETVLTLAEAGAYTADVVSHQLPRLPGGEVDVATVYAGINDVWLGKGRFDTVGYEAGLRTVVLAVRAGRLVMPTMPQVLGRPRIGKPVQLANEIIRAVAADAGAVVVSLDDMARPRWFARDRVHLTPAGHVEMAERAARALGAARSPRELAGR